MIICKHGICRTIFVHIFGDICVCPKMFILEVWGADLQYVGREHWGHLSRRKWVIFMKYIQKITDDVDEIYNRNFYQLFVLSHHKYIIVSILLWRKKSPAWSIPDQIRDVRIFLSGLPRPRPLSSRWSYPGRGQITFEKIIENSERGIRSLVSFSFSFVIKTLQTLDVSPHKSFQFLRTNFGNFMSKFFLFLSIYLFHLFNLIWKLLQGWFISQSRALAKPQSFG